jgi:hypothetical protein
MTPPRLENQDSRCTFLVLIFGFHPIHFVHASCNFMMIIVLEPCYEVMNHCNLPCELSIIFALCIVLHIAYIFTLIML